MVSTCGARSAAFRPPTPPRACRPYPVPAASLLDFSELPTEAVELPPLFQESRVLGDLKQGHTLVGSGHLLESIPEKTFSAKPLQGWERMVEAQVG